jgi:hypothetical protein
VQVGELGKTPDVTIFREQKEAFSSTQSFQGDKGYVGEPQIRTPHKKPKNQELTSPKKQENKALSSQRIFVEHLIRLIKLFRVAKERFRLDAANYKLVILTICGLVRLRIGALNLSVDNQPLACTEKALNNDQFLAEFLTTIS